ncbi:MAG: glycine cleavage system protein GcvH [Chloroflexi bacterium]|nr:MAG: glycine cleavage system protein GcvH [Chloroflexota bacterium]
MGKWKTPDDLKYTKNDEWLRIEGDTATVGISDYAQDQLNDIVFVELPDVGASLDKGDSFGVVESVKAAADVYMPIGGTITEVNNAVEDQPELLNTDPYGEGWIIKFTIKDASEANDLMDSAAYDAYCEDR